MNPQQPPVPPSQPQDPMKPVAYDQYGQPLYAHPPTQAATQNAQAGGERAASSKSNDDEPQVVHMTRSIDPREQEVPANIQKKHEDSGRRYPQLNLSKGEYVISAVKRHPIGLLSIWSIVVVAILIIFVGFPMLLSNDTFFGRRSLPTGALVSGGIMLLLTAVLFILGGIMATIVYQANRFYLTNESVIQHIQTSLFSKKDQTISLMNIEDASYRQKGILQTLLNYGSIRLSTEGEETTYRFNFVANPKKEIDRLNNAVEAFKSFRPVDPREDY